MWPSALKTHTHTHTHTFYSLLKSNFYRQKTVLLRISSNINMIMVNVISFRFCSAFMTADENISLMYAIHERCADCLCVSEQVLDITTMRCLWERESKTNVCVCVFIYLLVSWIRAMAMRIRVLRKISASSRMASTTHRIITTTQTERLWLDWLMFS